MSKRALASIGGGYANVIVATPAIAAIRSLGYEVDLLVESAREDAAGLLSGWEAVDTIYLSRRSMQEEGREKPYDAVARMLSHCGGTLGVGPETRPNPGAAGSLHEGAINLTVARSLGYAGEMPGTHVESECSFWPLPSRYVAVAPRSEGSSWPLWRQLCDEAHEETGEAVVIVGDEGDFEEWMRDDGRPWLLNWCGQASARVAAGILGACDAAIAGDNGYGHMAGALGRRTTSLMGKGRAERIRPLGREACVLETAAEGELAGVTVSEALEAAGIAVRRLAG